MASIDPLTLLRPCRKITGISAILLPFEGDGRIDWDSFSRHVERTANAGLIPAVNMDTGYVNLIDHAVQDEALRQARAALGKRPFVAGAFVTSQPDDPFRPDLYAARIEQIQSFGAVPVIFQSFGLTQGRGTEIIERYEQIGRHCDRFYAFELTTDLARFGAVYDIDTFAGLLEIRQCQGLKHSSFHREPEWERLKLRNERRPDFLLFTGNDFAVDMVMYGSDYLLGLSTFAPDLFARRDQYWLNGDSRFYELNDQLQYLGAFAFRSPSAAYKHSAAQFLALRGWATSNRTHPQSATRPDSDIEVLREMGRRMDVVPV